MLKTRVIPCLLLRGHGLVKTVNFRDEKYIGDPINAIRIFNEKEVDELIFLDVLATEKGKKPPLETISKVASECFMPLCYGGGITSLDDIKSVFSLGVEKVSINSYAVQDPKLIERAAGYFGSQSIVVSIDVRNILGKYEVFTRRGRISTRLDPVDFSVQMERMGAGEIFLNSIDKDGTMEGYNLELIRKVSGAVNIPIIACGGAGKIEDFRDAIRAGASAVAAGSLFVFWGPYRAVLINYPALEDLEKILD
jgi:cyclase